MAMLLGATLWIPTVRGTLSCDPSMYSDVFRRAVAAHDWPAALKAADAVLARDKRSQIWLQRKIGVAMRLGVNPREDVLKLLSINRTDARVRLPYAQTSRAGLTVPERIAQLKLALRLNAALPTDELERLRPEEVRAIQNEIATMQRTIHPPATSTPTLTP